MAHRVPSNQLNKCSFLSIPLSFLSLLFLIHFLLDRNSKRKCKLNAVAHTCNPSNSGGTDGQDDSSRSA
jgi:hypothetical protein